MYTNGYYAFRHFLRDHPEHAAHCHEVTLPDGTKDDVARADVWIAFARWSLLHGCGGAESIKAFLAEAVPRVEAMFRKRDEAAHGATSPVQPAE